METLSDKSELYHNGIAWRKTKDVKEFIQEILRINSTAHSRHQKDVLIRRLSGDALSEETEQGEKCPECKQFIGTNTMCSDCARFRRRKCIMVKAKELRIEIEEIKVKPVSERTQEDHMKLIKSFGGVRNYLLSIGSFKEDRRYFIYICKKCGYQMEESCMGEKCYKCKEWTYYKDCKKECVLLGESVA